MAVAAAPSTVAATRWLSRAPAKYSIVRATPAITRVVPRWGCSISSRVIRPVSARTGWSVERVSSMRRSGRDRRSATKTTKAILASSEGWNTTDPAPSQRRAPLALRPMLGTAVSASSTSDAPMPTGASRFQWW